MKSFLIVSPVLLGTGKRFFAEGTPAHAHSRSPARERRRPASCSTATRSSDRCRPVDPTRRKMNENTPPHRTQRPGRSRLARPARGAQRPQRRVDRRARAAAFKSFATDASDLRAIVVGGSGKAFCAGADLAFMREMGNYTWEQNRADAQALADMLWTMYSCPVPVIARIHGDCYAGGLGIASVLRCPCRGRGRHLLLERSAVSGCCRPRSART